MNTEESHFMIDLETLGTRPTSRIVSIGAVRFDALGVYTRDAFYTAIATPAHLLDATEDTYAEPGYTVDADTVQWWRNQSVEARQVFTDSEAVPLTTALVDFKLWLTSQEPNVKRRRVWGNGAAFDNVLLTHAYVTDGMSAPWFFWNDRCYRTLKALAPDVPPPPRTGTYHNARDDAITQAMHAQQILSKRLPMFLP